MAKRITINGRDIGFGTKQFQVDRLINKDGTYNVIKKGAGISAFSLYHFLINCSWFRFILLITSAYLLINIFFGSIYYWIGADGLSSFEGNGHFAEFMHGFFFSSQTLTTVGYGTISPTTPLLNFIAAIEAMIGLLGFAMGTGIMYGRFSKARAKILFSENALVSPYRGIKGMKFRIVNQRKNQLIDMQARVIYSYLHKEGSEIKRRYKNLDLEINFISMFAVPWTIVHPIDDKSPLINKTEKQLAKEEAEFIVILKGYDDTFNQYVHQMYDYKHTELIFEADFLPMFDAASIGMTEIHLNRISSYTKV